MENLIQMKMKELHLFELLISKYFFIQTTL